MIRDFIKITKNYYQLICDNKSKLIPYYIGYFSNVIIGLLIPIYVAKITDSLTNSLFKSAIISTIIFFVLKIGNNLVSYFTMYTYQRFYQYNYITIYKKIVNKIYNFDSLYKKNIPTGKMFNSLINDVVNIGEMADNVLTIILNTLTCIIIVFYFLRINVILSLLIIIIDIMYIYRCNYLNNNITKYSKKQRLENDKLIGLINQTLLGLKDIQTLGFSKSIDNKYNNIYSSWRKVYNNKKKYERERRSILKCFIVLTKTILYFICIYLIMKKELSIGIMLIIISYFDSLFSASENIMSASVSIKDQNISVNRIRDILEYNNIENKKLNNIGSIIGQIEFKNVFFSYNNDKFLENLNFIIKPNKITAIIGSNGVGKTTIINLILRLYAPLKGKIFLDNIDISSINKRLYLREISVLNQETYLFNLSIRENFNLINKNIKKQEEICNFIGIDNFIKKLPKGYDTIIDENSDNVSGGQQKLLSLARMLLKESKILIFDEVTSSLDSGMIKKIINILEKLKTNHTIIIITHKKEIIDISDEKIIVDKGHVKF